MFQTSIVQCRAGGWRAGPQGWSQAPGRTCAQKAKDTEAEPPACLCLPTGGPLYFFLHHSGTGGQESESQGLSTSEIKRTSQGRTHTGLGQDWGGGAVLTVGSSSFFPASWAPCLPHPRPGPGLSGCIFSKGQSGRRGANRFVPGHRRIQGHASQPGKYPFPPPNFLIVQGHRCGGCHHKSERSRHPKSSPDYSSAHYPKGSRTVWLHCRLLIGTRARQRLIC